MSWLILTLLSVLGVSIANILQRALMKDYRSDPYSYAVVFQFLIAVLILPIALLSGFQLPRFNTDLLFFVIAAILWAGASIFNFKALKQIEASEVIILSSVRVIITIIASIFFLEETFTSLNILGTIAILASVVVITNIKSGLKFNRGILYTFLMALFSGLAIVVDGFNVRRTDVISYNTIVNFLVVFILLLYSPKAINQLKLFSDSDFFKKMLPLGIFASLQGFLYLFAQASGGNTSLVGTIRQSSVIVTVILAIFFLNEKDHLIRKFIAVALVTLGVFLLS
jgi:drug/metabolite transporter (DMT)-like permease